MTEFDFFILTILLVSLLLGLWRGLVYEVLSLAGWPIAFVLSKLFANSIVPLLPVQQETVRLAVAYAVVFIIALIVWSVLVWLLARLVKMIGLGWLDSVMGGLFGALRGVLVILALVWLAGLTHIPEQAFWRGAQTSKTAEDIALMTKSWLPGNIAQRIHYGIRS
ncbi:MAG TPA: CvpA family protein [Gallionella sp.]|nr:CvpA family protein [Gallionella sp.]